MGFLDKLRGRDDEPGRPDDDPDAVSGTGDDDDDLDGIYAVEEVGTRRLTADEEAALEAVRAGYAAHGIDPADLDSVAAAYDLGPGAPRRRGRLDGRRAARHRGR